MKMKKMKSEHKEIVNYLSDKIEDVIDKYLAKNNEQFYAPELISVLISIHITSLFNLLQKISVTAPQHEEQINEFMGKIIYTIRNHAEIKELNVVDKCSNTLQ